MTTTNARKIRSRTARSAALSLTAGGLLLLGTAAPALAAPAGNNGTVKIDGIDFDSHPNNQPHVGCTFEVDFYGYDAGDLYADVTFEAQAPTSGGVLLTDTIFIGEDDNSGGGSEAGLDAHRAYDLSAALASIEPHPVQGHHVKLTVNADGAQGADVKHKVFWVEGCGPVDEPPVEDPPADEPPADEPPADEPPADEPPAEEPPADEPPALEPPSVLPSVVTPDPAPSAEVLGVSITKAQAAPASLPRTGTGSTTLLAAAGTALVALGAGVRRLGVRLG